MRADHKLALSLLEAAGLVTDRVVDVEWRSGIDEACRITVTYVIPETDLGKVAALLESTDEG